ncbi:MAG: bacteriohemerythrin [Magnetococcales bacterium]|nr:bacteriohemerythrin [Magnetococcales bacterium]
MEKLIKISVSKGIYWVEAPAAGLRILCGCPADAVKHLIRRGLIVAKEREGVVFETGPNAILLSDLMLQNDEFSNLAEFPVLQMLYKQGMIIPGHPGNTGEKPLLIGTASQVEAQLQYIYRGNYGLVSREELIRAGATSDQAEEMMRVKLRFAFGRIRPSQDLLDSCRVADGVRTEIRNGLHVCRLGTNRFRFDYEGEEVEVDLNMDPGERYQTPYPLGFQQLGREYFAVIHSGEGDGWDVNRPCMSSVLMFQGKVYIIDAGPHLHRNLTALGVGPNEIEGIFHTHAHDDHFSGLTALMRAPHKVKYFATSLVRASVEKKLAALLSIEEERFGDFFEVHDLVAGEWNDIEGLEVKPVFSPHPVETTIFLFRTLWASGYSSYAHFADTVSFRVLESMVTEDETAPGVSRTLCERVKADYLTPVDLKKIDVGGGMIHGMAEDFRHDASTKILLSHTSTTLTPEEKEIGSSASYGIVDILISGRTDFMRRSGYSHLATLFPELDLYQLRILINNELVEMNPGSIILKEGAVPDHVLLILSGVVERIRARDGIQNELSSGALVGELSMLDGHPSGETFRAASYVRALRIPVSLLMELLRRKELLPRLRASLDKRAFFQTTDLFGEGVPHPVLHRILEHAEEHSLLPGDRLTCRDLSFLNVIRTGRIRRMIGEALIDTLGPRDFYGEEGAIFELPCLFRVEVSEPTTIFRIPGWLIKDIPIVRWKLYNNYLPRVARILYAEDGSGIFTWRDAFSIRVLRMDIHHKKLVEIANSIIEILRTGFGHAESLDHAFQALISYSRYHFCEEEALLGQYGYPHLEAHRAAHVLLLERVEEQRRRIAGLDSYAGVDFPDFFGGWLIRHILSEDSRYGLFLNSKGIY